MSEKLRVVAVLAGDLQHQKDMQAKYGVFFTTLAKYVTLVEVYDANLAGFQRYWNALRSFHPSKRQWKERFFRNVPAFKARSKKVAAHLQSSSDKVDVVLQLGAMFDATINDSGLPVVVYTDNTTQISARLPDAGRMYFSDEELKNWTALENNLYHAAGHLAVRSDLIRKSLMQDYHIQDQQISVIGGGVNFPTLPIIKKFEISENPVVLFIGQDFCRKGGDYVLQAFAKVQEKIPSSRLMLVTGEPIADDLPLKNVEVINPIWDRDAIASMYRQSDVFVLPSRQETWGDVLLEAMAFGLPCIGVTGQSMENIIVDGKTGFLVAPEDSEMLAQALLRVLLDKKLRSYMGRNSRAHVESKFTWEHVVEKLLPILQIRK